MVNMVSAPTEVSPTKVPLLRLAPRLLAWLALLPRLPRWALGVVKRLRMPLLLLRRKDSGLAQILVLITRIIGEVSLLATGRLALFAADVVLRRLLWPASSRNGCARRSGPGLTDYIDSLDMAVVSPSNVSLKCAITTSMFYHDSNRMCRASFIFIAQAPTSTVPSFVRSRLFNFMTDPPSSYIVSNVGGRFSPLFLCFLLSLLLLCQVG